MKGRAENRHVAGHRWIVILGRCIATSNCQQHRRIQDFRRWGAHGWGAIRTRRALLSVGKPIKWAQNLIAGEPIVASGRKNGGENRNFRRGERHQILSRALSPLKGALRVKGEGKVPPVASPRSTNDQQHDGLPHVPAFVKSCFCGR